MRASGVSLFISPLVSPSNDTCLWLFVLVCLFVCLFAFSFAVVVCFLFCKCHGIFSNPPRVLDLDDRQGLTASSALQ